MKHSHEMRITAAGKKRIFRFSGKDAHTNWTDLYDSCALVNGDKEPDQSEEDGVLVGSIDVKTRWPEVIRIIEEDAGLCGRKTIVALRSADEAVTIA